MNTETTTPSPMQSVHDSPPTRRFWLLMAVSLIGVGAVAYLQFTRVDRARRGMGLALGEPSRLPVMAELPDFSLTERSGQPLSLKDLRGKVWVADFVFTYCGGPCPIMTHRMRQLQDILLRDRMEKVVCVSISVDPQRDTPAVLRDYAAKHSASPTRWQFLTGDEKAIRSLALDGFKLAVEEGTPAEGPLHSSRFVLVDRAGRIRGYYRALSAEEEEDLLHVDPDAGMPKDELNRLLADIQSLIREGGR